MLLNLVRTLRGRLARQDSRNGYLPRPCACLVWRQPRGEPTPVGFFDVIKGASLRVARSDWTAARVLFKMDNEKWTAYTWLALLLLFSTRRIRG
jgi:hypothetical protein